MPECADLSEIAWYFVVLSPKKKKVIVTRMHALVHILATASIAVARLMFSVHD